MSFDIDQTLKSLTKQQKIALLAGTDFWHTTAIEEHDVPAICVSDGPNGVRGTLFFAGVPAACLPCGTALGATWDRILIESAGELIGKECLAKGAHCWLGPTINIQRSPLGGRGFESYSEDPLLSGTLAASIIKGVSSQHVIATPKHFVCNDQEHERNAVNTIVTERALREIYLRPFQIIARDAPPAALMTAYNKVNGEHASDSSRLLEDIVRKEWKWDPLIMSDWFGVYSTATAINAGLDLEMPGPTVYRGPLLDRAMSTRQISENTLDQRARRVLSFVKQAAKAQVSEEESERNTKEDRELNRKLAAESIVLLKNRGALPLQVSSTTPKKIVLIGSHMKEPAISGGGSASLDPYYVITPFDAIRQKLQGTDSTPTYELGASAHKSLPVLGSCLQRTDGSGSGAIIKFYNEPSSVADRECIGQELIKETTFFLADYVKLKRLNRKLFYAQVEATLTSDTTGTWDFSLSVFGSGRLYIDDHLVIDNTKDQKQGTSFFGAGTIDVPGSIDLEAGKEYRLVLEFGSSSTSTLGAEGLVDFGGGAARLGGSLRYDALELRQKAVAAAKDADHVIVCTGLNSDWESEGFDRPNMKLPPGTDDLIDAVSKANSNTVVVTQSGTPLEMPWHESVNAIVHAWYGGNESGNGIADVLFGDVNASGKLPLSWPVKLQDNPSYLNFGATNGRVLYGEDVFVGYRGYEAMDRKPLFPFGHGLSYTTFSLSNLLLGRDVVYLTVNNSGQRAGSVVIQVYIAAISATVNRPPQELAGFGKVYLEPGETQDLTIDIDPYAMSYWDESNDMWSLNAGEYQVRVGTSSQEIMLTETMKVDHSERWLGLKGPVSRVQDTKI